MSEVLLETVNLRKYFKTPKGNLHAVDDINLSIKAGKTLGVVGESGCGKSTLGRTILRLIEPTSGQILYRGEDISKYNKKKMWEMHHKMQIIFQDPYASLNPRMTVLELIMAPLEAFGIGTMEERVQRVKEIMELVGMPENMMNRYPHEFSGGQRQRIGIARALVMQPEFIVADEPISALDVSIRAQVLNLLNEMKKSRGLTYLFIAHDLSVMRYISDRIAVIHKGDIVELADAEELVNHAIHPYTRSLLSAIPMPNPRLERKKKLLVYDPAMHDYTADPPQWQELRPNHFVLCNAAEAAQWIREL